MLSVKPVLVFILFLGMGLLPGHTSAQSDQITGLTTLEEIIKHDSIFGIYINRYQPDKTAVEYLSTVQDSITLQVFFGSWCRESKKYIPQLAKTLKLANSKKIAVNYIGVDAQKKVPKSFLKKYYIKYIPTIVVLKGNEEVGRLVEAPQTLIELNLVEVLKESTDKF